jgi:UDP-GlcNAc3NAcA epimerase
MEPRLSAARIIVNLVGARPQFIKAAAVSRALRAVAGLREVLVHTGQHFDHSMSQRFFDELSIPIPDYNLGIGSGSHGVQTGRMLEAIERVLLGERPAWVIVYGDTNSTLAGALAAAKLGIPVAHVEAGLRSFNRAMPEEINRVVTDHLATLLFAPTEAAMANLAREGIAARSVVRTGDVMYDAMLHVARDLDDGALAHWGVSPGAYALASVHRAENTDNPQRLAAIFGGLAILARRIPVVLPLHPRTKLALKEFGIEEAPTLRLVEPVGFLDMQLLERHARLIVTDSGGVQKEAYFHSVPCVTLRNETEWIELVESGWNVLLPPTAPEAVAAGLEAALMRPLPAWQPIYGDGHASEQIVAEIGAR